LTTDIVEFFKISLLRECSKIKKGEILTVNEREHMFKVAEGLINFLVFGCNDFVLMTYP